MGTLVQFLHMYMGGFTSGLGGAEAPSKFLKQLKKLAWCLISTPKILKLEKNVSFRLLD